MNRCKEGAGYISLYKVLEDNILWADFDCNDAAGPGESLKPGITKAREECNTILDELLELK